MKHREKIVMTLFILLLVSACTSTTKTSSLDSYIEEENSESTTTETSSLNTVQEIDGVQTVTLSWGKFNYIPETITVRAGKPVRITADLTRLSGCFQSLVIPELGIEHYFDVGTETLEFTPTTKGTFAFSCAMGMGKGMLIVE
jgi:plastocyanin domain-containing protein